MNIDGSVKMICCGENGEVADFLGELKSKGKEKGAMIEDISQEEIPFKLYLPQRFLRLYTDDFTDIGRKLDTGNDVLGGIKVDTSSIKTDISSIKTDTSSLPEIKDVMGSFVIEQREHNRQLRQVLEKLAEK